MSRAPLGPGRANPGAITWEGDLVPPVTSYASSRPYGAPASRLYTPPSTNLTNSAVVMRRPRRKGLRYFYRYGGVVMPVPDVPRPGPGGVLSSAFQRILVHMDDWVQNDAWFAAGYPRNMGYTFRVGQLKTQVTGGSGPGAMEARPLFPRVQVVPRYSSTPRMYPTVAHND